MLGILLPKVILEISTQRDKIQALLKITTKTADKQTNKQKMPNSNISISCCVFKIIHLFVFWIWYQTSTLKKTAACFEVQLTNVKKNGKTAGQFYLQDN